MNLTDKYMNTEQRNKIGKYFREKNVKTLDDLFKMCKELHLELNIVDMKYEYDPRDIYVDQFITRGENCGTDSK
jgi:predicted hydrocarbon binding protein